MRNKESRSNIDGDQLGMASVSYAAPHNDAALILLNLLRQLNSCTAAHVSAARGDRAKTIAPVASCQHLEQDVCHVVWDKVFPTSKHETIIWRLLAEDDGGFETEAGGGTDSAGGGGGHDPGRLLGGGMIEFDGGASRPLVEWAEGNGVAKGSDGHHHDHKTSNAYGAEHSVFQTVAAAPLTNTLIGRVVAYDVVKFMPHTKDEAWKRVLDAVNVDLTRADHTDHTIAALNVLNAIPGSMLLQFVTTLDVESRFLSALEHETCKALRSTAVGALGDVFLRTIAKLQQVDYGDGLKSHGYDSIAQQRRQRQATFDRALLVWKRIAKCAEDVEDSVSVASFRAVHRLLREGHTASIMSIDVALGMAPSAVEEEWRHETGGRGDENAPGLDAPHSVLFEFHRRFANAIGSRFHLLVARMRCLPPPEAGPAADAISYLLCFLLKTGVRVRIDEPPRYESPVDWAISFVDTILMNMLELATLPGVALTAAECIWRLAGGDYHGNDGGNGTRSNLLRLCSPRWFPHVLAALLRIFRQDVGYPFYRNKSDQRWLRNSRLPNTGRMVELIMPCLPWIPRLDLYRTIPSVLRAICGIADASTRMSYFQHTANLVLVKVLNEEGEDLNLEGDGVGLRMKKALLGVFEDDEWVSWLMNIANQSQRSAPSPSEPYHHGVRPLSDPFRCRAEIIITFMLSWSRKFNVHPSTPVGNADTGSAPEANPFRDAVAIAYQMLWYFKRALLWPNRAGKSSAVGACEQGSAVAHLYCDIVEAVCFGAEEGNAPAKNGENIDAVITLLLENVSAAPAPSVRIRILLILCRYWDGMEPDSSGNDPLGGPDQRRGLLIDALSFEVEALFLAMKEEDVDADVPLNSSEVSINAGGGGPRPASGDVVLERATVLLGPLGSFLGHSKDAIAVVGVKERVYKTVIGLGRDFVKRGGGGQLLRAMVNDLLAVDKTAPALLPAVTTTVAGSGQLMFTDDSTFPDTIGGPSFEYFSALQAHIFCPADVGQGPGRGIDSDHDNRNALLAVSRRSVFFTDRLWLQHDRNSFLSPAPFRVLSGGSDPIMVKVRHRFFPLSGHVEITTQLISMMNFPCEGPVRLHLSISSAAESLVEPTAMGLEHTFTGLFKPLCVMQFNTLVSVKRFGPFQVMPHVFIENVRAAATGADQGPSKGGSKGAAGEGQQGGAPPASAAGASESSPEPTAQSHDGAVGAGGTATRGGVPRQSGTTSPLATSPSSFQGGSGTELTLPKATALENEGGCWEDDSSDDEEGDSERVVCLRCTVYNVSAIETVLRGPTWLRDCPNAFSRLWNCMGQSFLATATAPFDKTRAASPKELIGLAASLCRSSFRFVGFTPVAHGVASGGFVGKTAGEHWLAFTIVVIHRDSAGTGNTGASTNKGAERLVNGDDDTCYTSREMSYINAHRTYGKRPGGAMGDEAWSAQFEFRSDSARLLTDLHEAENFVDFFHSLTHGLFSLSVGNPSVGSGKDGFVYDFDGGGLERNKVGGAPRLPEQWQRSESIFHFNELSSATMSSPSSDTHHKDSTAYAVEEYLKMVSEEGSGETKP